MKCSRGNALAQYGIIIALVAIGLVPTFMFLGSNILKGLTNFSSFLGDNNEIEANNAAINSGTSPALTLSGTATQEDPEIACTGSNCAIDFGDYVLDGIPADFSTYVSTTGTAGGTEKLASVLKEMAEEANLDETTTDLITKLANNGYSLASAQSSVQSIVENDVPLSAWVGGMYSSIDEGTGGPYDQFLANKAAVEALLEGASTTDQKNIKEVINILSTEITNLNEELISKCTTVSSIYASGAYTDSSLKINDVIDLGLISEKTDIDSAIICKTGDGTNEDGACK